MKRRITTMRVPVEFFDFVSAETERVNQILVGKQISRSDFVRILTVQFRDRPIVVRDDKRKRRGGFEFDFPF